MAGVSSAKGFLSLLDEPGDELRLFSLKALGSLVHNYWADIAESLPKIVALTTDPKFPHQQEAYLLASKVYYHLNNMEDSLKCALGAGNLIDVTASGQDEFLLTLIKHSIDTYVRLRHEQVEAESKKAEIIPIDRRLEEIVLSMFEKCFRDGEYKQVLGIALECRRMDKVRQAITSSENVGEMLEYCFRVALRVVKNLDFRKMVLRELVDLYNELEEKDYFQVTQILILLDDASAISKILEQFLERDEELLAYQLGFDLCDSSTQEFLARIQQEIRGRDEDQKRKRLLSILEGKLSVELHLSFLCRSNKTDLAVLKNIRESVEQRNLVCHNATIFANALMHAGTTKDGFLRDNLEWLQKATHWARFSATAGLGVIHKGHLKAGMNLLRPYLPVSPPASPYSEGGSLYALGIIHANHGQEVTQFLLGELQKAKLAAHSHPQASEVIQHGASLGIGLAAMATGNLEIYETLMDVVMLENAVAGEGAGLAIGLVMLGSCSEQVIMSMLKRAQLAQHEKIIRGLAIGMALVMYGCEEQADALIEQLSRDKDSILRYGGMFMLGLAYCGTANNSAISRLLHIAVSDVSDDVRRAAVMNLGFLLCAQPEQCPKIVSLLAESYNPHVRYGATLAVGLSCAGSGLKEAIALLEPMTKDPVDFVRQGAMIALAMVVIQTSQGENPKVEKVRKLFESCVADKHEDIMAKFGAIIAASIVNGGGRNVTISPLTSSGYHKNMCAIVGLAIFCQYWYWYPLMHFVCLAFTPVAAIGLNKDLEMPVWSFKSNARPSRFAYPPEFKPPQKEAPKKVSTAVLSTSKKAKVRAQQRAEERASKGLGGSALLESMDVDKAEEEDKKEEEEKKKEEEEKKKAEPEPEFEIKENPGRVTSSQRAFISCDPDSRWQPIKKTFYGITLLKDTTPEEPVVLVTDDKKGEEKEKEGAKEGAKEEPKEGAKEDAKESDAASPSGSGEQKQDEAMDEEDEAPPPPEFDFDE
mmetsp:Transcript_32100/g.43961  ORF Transcript_32100/g.43961 Transcript_32100/m.43961 type:complete len:985 (-) Transcript_32100:98-3052(-)|eukprot:CAMPEP_0201492622 /NCGR_PEP_ID=MMETSP0151_2-20130828/34045_1 /ASSEMBLY_ACC=CAM_ASM_000257 /TAXON_ID=200890 /ORGANISM="Paramoeba atlantica, Strain 621/1 / CCAP 1560/9" /LENGTH=984 /DNA_ID=CAMNT_0047879541 /DNA_START=24 /DNA_END=2978 /DNA_ORIENTATION=+